VELDDRGASIGQVRRSAEVPGLVDEPLEALLVLT
jgi:hypothetical protein